MMGCLLLVRMLPVAERGVEDKVYEFLADFLAKLVLHVGEHQRGVKLAVGREGLVDVVGRVLGVGIFHMDGDREPCLGGVSVGADGLRGEGIARYLARELEVAFVAVELLEPGVARHVVEQLVLKRLLQRRIDEGGPDGEVADVDGLVEIVIDR